MIYFIYNEGYAATSGGDLTRAERQLAAAILENYPIPGLGSITELAELADVSTPTVARLVQKLGFSGYPEFQQALRAELSEIISNPAQKRAEVVPELPETHVLHRFSVAARDNIRATLEGIDLAEFDALRLRIADPKRRVHIAGGRLSGTIAQTLYLHMQMIREGVFFIPPHASWTHSLLDLGSDDTLIAQRLPVQACRRLPSFCARSAGAAGVGWNVMRPGW